MKGRGKASVEVRMTHSWGGMGFGEGPTPWPDLLSFRRVGN